jgi:hypothetical protein
VSDRTPSSLPQSIHEIILSSDDEEPLKIVRVNNQEKSNPNTIPNSIDEVWLDTPENIVKVKSKTTESVKKVPVKKPIPIVIDDDDDDDDDDEVSPNLST